MEEEIQVKKGLSLKAKILLSLVLAVAVAVTVCFTVFSVKHVMVTGNYRTPAQTVLNLAGLSRGGLYFLINEDSVRKGIESDYTLQFVSLEKEAPDTVRINIRERVPAGYITFQGQQYLIDTQGFVLQAGVNTSQYPLELRGLTVRDVRVGESISTVGQQQLSAYQAVTEELYVQGMLQQFVEINVTDAKNVCLVTRDGLVAALGNSDEMRAKLLTLGGVLQYMNTYGLKPGSLDVSVPGYCTYTPEN